VPTIPSGSRNAARFVVSPSPSSTVVIPSPTNEPPFRATLEVSPTPPVDVNQEVTFTVMPNLPGANIQYRFHFGDDKMSDWITQSQTTHRYFQTKAYLAYAEIRGPEGSLAQGTKNTPRKEVLVVQRSSPTPTSTATSVPITPSPTSSYTPPATPSATASVPASPSPYSPSPTAIVSGASTTATPLGSSPGVASPTATRSPPKQYTATPTPVVSKGGPPSWIYYIVSAGLAAAVLYGILKLIKPTFHPHADWHEPQEPPQNVAINYGLYFHSNVSAGQDRLQTDGASLILRRRTQ